MIKIKTIHFLAHEDDSKYVAAIKEHEDEIQKFFILIESEGHTFISMNEVSYGRFKNNNRTKTTILYRENLVRKVIVEKKRK